MTETGTAPIAGISDFFRTFAQGLAAIVLIYGLGFIYIWIQGPAYLQTLEPVIVAAPPAPVPADHVPPKEKELKPVGDLFGPFFKPVMGPERQQQMVPEHPPVVPDETVRQVIPESAHEDSHEEPHGDSDHSPPAEMDPFAALPRLPSGLLAAPVPGLFEESPTGKLPVAGKGDFTPFNAYRRPWTAPPGERPVISVLLYGIGLSDSASEAALKDFPPDVTLALSPYALTPELWVNEGRSKGHEIWLALPLESRDYPRADPGPYTVMTGLSEKENSSRLAWLMGRAVGYAGLVGPYDSLFSANPNALRSVLSELFRRGLAYVGSSRDAGTMGESLALGMNAPYSKIDLWIGWPAPTAQSIREGFSRLEDIAREQGYASAALDVSALSRAELSAWLKTVEARGFVLAPLSAQTGL